MYDSREIYFALSVIYFCPSFFLKEKNVHTKDTAYSAVYGLVLGYIGTMSVLNVPPKNTYYEFKVIFRTQGSLLEEIEIVLKHSITVNGR